METAEVTLRKRKHNTNTENESSVSPTEIRKPVSSAAGQIKGPSNRPAGRTVTEAQFLNVSKVHVSVCDSYSNNETHTDTGLPGTSTTMASSETESGKSDPNKAQGSRDFTAAKNEKPECVKSATTHEKGDSYRKEETGKCEIGLSVCKDIQEVDETKCAKVYYVFLIFFTQLALYMRLYNIEIPDHICWDETHFGKMGSWYINRTFFFDVHPPLGKMLIGLSGYLTGYDGSFHFAKPGDEYGDTRYVGMRVFCAILGSALVPLAFQIVFLLTQSLLASVFAATIVLFDTGVNTLSRYILLDPPLLFFIMAATYSKLKFLSFKDRPFSVKWWFWMVSTGVSLSGAIGVKFVGLFVILLVGIWTVCDLNRLLSEVVLPLSQVVKHLLARAVGLIALPAFCYIVFFYIHFKVLNHSGSGDGFFSSAFQSQLVGNKLYNVSMPQNIAFGSVITLKQRRTGGAYLHSHPHLYPEDLGPRQQQVTTYSHKDENNLWKVKPADRDVGTEEPVILVKNGDLIRLEHFTTRRNLHSHKEPAPLSRRHYQVSGYGVNGTGDANDVWLVEVMDVPQGAPIQTVRSQIRLVHYYVRCALFSHDKKLPKWGWEQLEATCNTNTRDFRSRWSVEEVRDARLPNVSFELYSPSFIEKLTESHAVMMQGNSGLKPKEWEVTSQPWQWPINYKGQVFSGKEHRVYLLGNPALFWAALVLKLVFLMCYTIHMVRRKRHAKMSPALIAYSDKVFSVAWWLLLGWALHYLPFWGMSRVLYFHHYFPAFLFSAMFCGVMLDYLVTQVCMSVPEGLSLSAFCWCLGLILGCVLYSFYLFYPLTYGMKGSPPSGEGGDMHGLRWLESWDF
ncbi:protein O-mannosyl-transferase 2-like [Babylonia areolata]|uniref:protein O-mannosyl-transferase 2-like n=1 Tax=Babylonia areolata TaxID=304850 RepID=UPI003FD0B768